MTWVKICGTTNLEDALLAVEAGADAVGFVFYEKSPRNIAVDAAAEITSKLPQSIEKIGVFVLNGDVDPSRVFLEAGLTGTQTYFSFEDGGRSQEGFAIGTSLLPDNVRFLTALPMNLVGADEDQIQQMATDFRNSGKNLPQDLALRRVNFTIVLDSGDLRQPGGTGKTFDWRAAQPAIRNVQEPIIVAGGLNAQNVHSALEVLQPWGVDVVSGVESYPGRKHPGLVTQFIDAVRQFDARLRAEKATAQKGQRV